MGYPNTIKEAAFEMFVKGYSYARIAEEIGARFGLDVAERTVKRWAKKYDWHVRKRGVLLEARKALDERLADEIASIEKEVLDLRRKIMEEMEPLSLRSKERAIEAVIKLTDLWFRMQKDRRPEVDADRIVQAILEVLLEHPKIGPLMERYRDEIAAKIEEKLGGEKR
ncbi:MAG: hypothetical protein L3J76_01755 [Candidatus Hydrothermae bacterium]|nr:hypothetical protein [Candidatus Hydrothermae bacterium]